MGEWWMKDQHQHQQHFKMEPHDPTDVIQTDSAPGRRVTQSTSVITSTILNGPGNVNATGYHHHPHHQQQQQQQQHHRALLHSLDNDEPHHARLRANTWPVNQLEKDPDGERATLPTLPEEDQIGGGGSGGSNDSSTDNLSQNLQSGGSVGGEKDGDGSLGGGAKKKNSARRNPWGNMSYADLIERSIESAPDKRLTLSQIYDWLIQNIPYFKEKADTNSSAGWKNSVRHNLSLHNRFMRVQNETGTGKSSWWMVNMSAKFDKPSRRRAASMETKEYEKRKGRMKKTQLRDRDVNSPIAGGPGGGGTGGTGSSDTTSPAYLSVSSMRSRASSNASSYGCLSPKSPSLDDHTSPGLSPRSWSTGSTGYDSTGSISGLGYGFPFENDFANALAKNVRISAPPAFESSSVRQMQPNTAIGNYHPLATNGFYDPPRTYFAGQFPSIPEEPRNHAGSHQQQQQQQQHPSQPPQQQYFQSHGHPLQQQLAGPKVVSSTSVLAESGVSGGNFTTFSSPFGHHHHQWSLPQDLESFNTEPVQSFDFDWEELLQQEAAIERNMQTTGAGGFPPGGHPGASSGRFLNADAK